LLIFVLMVAMNLLQLRGERKKKENLLKAEKPAMRTFKRVMAIVTAVAVFVGCGFLIFGLRNNKTTINVYNWGQYISDGQDGTLDVIAEFERRYPQYDVQYSTYDSNEVMYSKLANGGITVDLVIPSDYMIARMIQENMLLELNFENIPNYENIDPSFRNKDFDPDNRYSVPYTWGTVGILYNTKYVDEADVTGWELLWNEKYKGHILMFGNSRDAFGITQYMLGYKVNTDNKTELEHCARELEKQEPLLQNYVMDEIFSIMENGEAWIAPYYAGDCYEMICNNPDLAFYFPQEQGFNIFIDAMCIPSCAKEKDGAECFINFLCDPYISGSNLGALGYSTPIEAAKQYMDPDMVSSPLCYPDAATIINATSFAYLPEDITRYMDSLFMEIRK